MENDEFNRDEETLETNPQEPAEGEQEAEGAEIDWEAEAKKNEAEAKKWQAIAQRNKKKEETPNVAKKDKSEKSEHSQSGELDYGQKAYLKAYGIAGSEELALVKQFQDRGFDLDSIVEDDVFTSKLNNLRQAKASTNAVPKSKNRSGQPISSSLDEAMIAYKETGKLPTDFETRNKLIDKLTNKEKTSMFDGLGVSRT